MTECSERFDACPGILIDIIPESQSASRRNADRHARNTQARRTPFGTLYELISDGLHQRSEDECMGIFYRCKTAFEYVVKKLTEARRRWRSVHRSDSEIKVTQSGRTRQG